jgi:hypothetical protein
MPAINLSVREWLVVGVTMLVLIVVGPMLWQHSAETEGPALARIPYESSSDYWLYSRFCERAAAQHKIAVIGDSVIWGHYVAPDQTLSSYLNARAGQDQFANLGLDGTHPAALQGLLTYYARPISGQTVLLHFNPLWLCSEKHDLSIAKEFQFNHPKLVPQFVPKVPCYRASFSQRMNAVIERYMPFLSWMNHVRITCFDNLDIPAWTMEHPYQNPLGRIADWRLRIADSRPESNPLGTAERAVAGQSEINDRRSIDVQWVALEHSIQWRSFRQAVELLKRRKNKVFVLVGPFNEHRLDAENAATYDRIKRTIDAWLTASSIPHWVAPALPASQYVDLSHPAAEGYQYLAQQLLGEPSFRAVIESRSDR